MSQPTDTHNSGPAPGAQETLGQKAARLIDDPVGSVMIGTALPAFAVTLIVGGIYGLTLTY
jgi:hypothetical protein